MDRPLRRGPRWLAGLACLIGLAGSTPPARAVPDVSGDIFYHFMPIAWRDSDNDAWRFGDFNGMTASLDYLSGLGVTAIWMNPIFPSPAYHGYQHGDASLLNPWFGTETQFVNFVRTAHERGIKVYLDYVAYGISHNSTWFQGAYGNPASPYDAWLAFQNAGNTTYWGSTFTTWNGSSVGFIFWDHNNSNPTNLVTQWAAHWLDPNGDHDFSDGVDGYRLDHVWDTYPYAGGLNYHINTFWAPWRTALRAVNPDVFVFAEQADWGIHGQELFPGMDAAFTKPFEFAARDALIQEDAAPLRNEMPATIAARTAGSASGTFLATIGNHDVSRLASVIGDNVDKGKAAAAILLTQPFPPCLYAGDEIGMRGSKNGAFPGDAADIPMREPFKWLAVAGPPMSNYYALNSAAYNGRTSQDHDGRSVEEQAGVTGSLLETYRSLIAARKASPALTSGTWRAVPNVRPAVWTFLREDPAQQVLVAINLSGQAWSDILDLSGYSIPGGATIPVDLVTGATLPAIDNVTKKGYTVTLPPYGFWILDVDLTLLPTPSDDIDGRTIPADFGPPHLVATQTCATSMGDNVAELDQLFVRSRQDTLLIGVTGNLATDGRGFALFLDTEGGGQNVLNFGGYSPPPNGPEFFGGLRFDAGFSPDRLIYVNTYGGAIYVDQMELPTGAPATRIYRGAGTVGDGDGWLAGGTNPHQMRVAMDNSNTAGITGGGVGGAATATKGFELAIPFEDVGLAYPTATTIGLACFINLTNGVISNQWLPGLPFGRPNPGIGPDMTAIPGTQYATLTVPLDVVGVREPDRAPGLDFTASAPGHRQPVEFQWTLAAPTTVTLRVFDVRGRLVRSLIDGAPQDAGAHGIRWDGADGSGREAPAGVYYSVLQAGRERRSLSITRLP